MINMLCSQRGKLALLIGGLVIGYAAAAWKRLEPVEYDPWTVD